MKVLHLASFGGNFGDILNHQGFYNTVGRALHFESIDKIEIRRFYKNATEKERLYFNRSFVEDINSHDLLVVGGGGFFDVKWDYSSTGTTIDFSDSFVDSIKVPVVFNALGYHEFYDETTPEVRMRFRHFLEKIIEKGWFVSFRNDGSLSRFHKTYGSIFDDEIIKVPDNGFFCVDKESITDCFFSDERVTIGFCITNDLFTKEYNGELTASKFNERIVDVLQKLSEDYRIVLFAHTPDDVSLIGRLFDSLPNSIKRYNIAICPFCPNGSESIKEMSRYYQACSLIVGMRFHSLILSLQLNKPSIALSNHAQIGGLFEELGLDDYIIRLNDLSFNKILYKKIRETLDSQAINRRVYNTLCDLKKQNLLYTERLKEYTNL